MIGIVTQLAGGVTGSQPDNSLILTSNYLYSLCRGYNLKALSYTNGGGSISPITGIQQFPIYITQGNFTTATFYPNTKIFGNNIAIFLNQINRYLVPSEVSVSSSGITILLDGFDATQFEYELVIEKVYN